jgi:hypothetical protein
MILAIDYLLQPITGKLHYENNFKSSFGIKLAVLSIMYGGVNLLALPVGVI